MLNSPQHKQGIGDRCWTITGIEPRAKGLVRVAGTVSGDNDFAAWALPNPTIRISLGEQPVEFAGIPCAPTATSRVYTLAEVDVDRRLIEVDIVKQGESSAAMRWLNSLAIGDEIAIVGPRPHRVPTDAPSRILLADSSALPAAARILRTMNFDGPTHLIAAVPADEFAIVQAELAGRNVELQRVDTALSEAFAALDVPATASVWASSERDDIREIRRRCKHDLGITPENMQVLGYWKRGTTNTAIDIARLTAIAAGDGSLEIDDFDIDI
ncbi:siderophore-interacting protein [Corynebacterium casei]|uniref:siderophore-interacting protein n=1 Tax=Corynebacterium casei TaxID=160386 RepID=UPI003F9183BB